MTTPLPTRAEVEARVQAARAKVRVRPALADIAPIAAGEESVWRYPRPPRVERTGQPVRLLLDGVMVARTEQALRVLETTSPPVMYFPQDALIGATPVDRDDHALCEWKGLSRFVDLHVGEQVVEKAGWRFPDPFDDLGRGYARLTGHVAFYPALFECWLGDERAEPQPGDYYGGWVTSMIKGPFKGEAGTEDW